MMKLLASVAIAATASGVVPPPPAHGPAPSPPAAAKAPYIRLPGFAPWLADQPLPAGADAWPAMAEAVAWQRIAASASDGRQAARWAYATSLIAAGRGPEAIGVLDVMIADDPDLTLVAAWQRARGVAEVQTHHYDEGLAALNQIALARDPESCLWRLRALGEKGDAPAALGQVDCARPALGTRQGAARRPFAIAAARAADGAGQPHTVLAWLADVPDADPAANLLRGKAQLALGQAQQGRLLLDRAALSGSPHDQADARLTTLERDLTTQAITPAEAAKRLDPMLFGWRGDALERRALLLSMQLGRANHDPMRELAAGAILARYFDLGADAGALAATVQARLKALLAPESKLPLAQAVGLFWDYREFALTGIDGVRFAEVLVGRLQAAGLYSRAADLLDYRLKMMAADVGQGPLAIRIASLRILDGDPAAAIRVLRATDDIPYPETITVERRRLEAVALDLLGESREALATLDDVPDGMAIRAEIYWRSRDWARLATTGTAVLPPPGRLNEVGQAIVLRQAIALSMLGRADGLARLHARYAGGFAGLPTASAFELLTGKPGAVDPGSLTKAMGALPTANPAGPIGDLMDAGRTAMAARAKTAGPG